MSSVLKMTERLNEIFFVDGVKALEHCWRKCVALDGVYAKKTVKRFWSQSVPSTFFSWLIDQPSYLTPNTNCGIIDEGCMFSQSWCSSVPHLWETVVTLSPLPKICVGKCVESCSSRSGLVRKYQRLDRIGWTWNNHSDISVTSSLILTDGEVKNVRKLTKRSITQPRIVWFHSNLV